MQSKQLQTEEVSDEMIDFVLRSRDDPTFFFRNALQLPVFKYEGNEMTHWSKQVEIAKHVRL